MPPRPPIDPHKGAKRKASKEELLIWDYVTQEDRRLPDASIDWQQVEQEIAAEKSPKTAECQQAKASDDQLDSLVKKTEFTAAGAAHAQPPRKVATGVDANSLRRLRQGRMPVEATLDMHGMYREEAHQQLASFIQRAYERGQRCVLVITGKGRFHAADDSREAGVLKKSLPRWLAQPPVAPLILAHCAAQPHHGGDGAAYILLRRQR
jgi:DNA-nicking Smr family endonuclease